MSEETKMRILQSNDLSFHFQILLYDDNKMDLDFKAMLYNYLFRIFIIYLSIKVALSKNIRVVAEMDSLII